MQPNEAKLKLLQERIKGKELRKREVLAAARVVADSIVDQLQIPKIELSEDMKETLVQLAVTLGALNKRYNAAADQATKTVSAVSSAMERLSNAMPDKVVAELSDEQMTLLSRSMTESFIKLAQDLKIENKFSVPTIPAPIVQLDDITIPGLIPAIQKIADAVPDKVTGTVDVNAATKKQPATQYLNVRMTNGLEFVTPGGGSSVRLAPGGGGEDGGGGGPSEAVQYHKIIDDVTTAGVTYIGRAVLTGGAIDKDDPVWQIKRITDTTVSETDWANGNDDFSNVWNDRATTVEYN